MEPLTLGTAVPPPPGAHSPASPWGPPEGACPALPPMWPWQPPGSESACALLCAEAVNSSENSPPGSPETWLPSSQGDGLGPSRCEMIRSAGWPAFPVSEMQ